MKKIFLIYGHYNDSSFNAAIKDTFIKQANEIGHKVDFVDLYKEKFDPVFDGEDKDETVKDHRRRIEESDVITLIAPIWNFRMPAIVEGWIDKVLAPPWAFRFIKLFGNYGYPQFAVKTFFYNMPTKRLRRGVFNICGITDVTYRRYFAVPFVSDEKRKKFLDDVKKTTSKI